MTNLNNAKNSFFSSQELYLSVFALIFGGKVQEVSRILLTFWDFLRGSVTSEQYVNEFSFILIAFGIGIIWVFNTVLFSEGQPADKRNAATFKESMILIITAFISILDSWIKGEAPDNIGSALLFFSVFIALIFIPVIKPHFYLTRTEQTQKISLSISIFTILLISCIVGAIYKQAAMGYLVWLDIFPNVNSISNMRDLVPFEVDSFIILGSIFTGIAFWGPLFCQTKYDWWSKAKTITLMMIATIVAVAYVFSAYPNPFGVAKAGIPHFDLVIGFIVVASSPMIAYAVFHICHKNRPLWALYLWGALIPFLANMIFLIANITSDLILKEGADKWDKLEAVLQISLFTQGGAAIALIFSLHMASKFVRHLYRNSL